MNNIYKTNIKRPKKGLNTIINVRKGYIFPNKRQNSQNSQFINVML
jgi:hypothetical protein